MHKRSEIMSNRPLVAGVVPARLVTDLLQGTGFRLHAGDGFQDLRAEDMSRSRAVVALLTLWCSGCGDSFRAEAPASDLAMSSLPGVYGGTFPCTNCAGIATTLWLRPDGRFFFRQRYPAEDPGGVSAAYNIGRWHWDGTDGVLVLAGAGPPRKFLWPHKDRLEMLVPSELDHRLSRSSASPAFTDRVRMEGIAVVHDGKASFTECLTGLVAEVKRERDYPRFLRQYRKLAQRAVFAELEGHFAWGRGGSPASLVIDRFLTVKPGQTC